MIISIVTYKTRCDFESFLVREPSRVHVLIESKSLNTEIVAGIWYVFGIYIVYDLGKNSSISKCR